jgi:4-carboxymuconolactone decarboxylase
MVMMSMMMSFRKFKVMRRFFSGRIVRFTPEKLKRDGDEEKIELYERILEDRGKTGAKGGFPVTNEDGSLVGPWNAMVVSPTIGNLTERMGHFCRHKNTCAPDLYEIGILVVGARWRSQFEWFAHEKLAKKAGVSEEAIRGIQISIEPEKMSSVMTEDQQAVYKYATELHNTKRVSESTHKEALRAVGSEQALVDLVFTMGFYHQISMTLNAFDVPLPPGEKFPFDDE